MDETDLESQMLVLSRKKDERILLGNNVEIVVVELRSDRARLGVIAPRMIPAHRAEVYASMRSDGLILPDLVPAQPPQNTILGA
jgi:carbon storage regulator